MQRRDFLALVGAAGIGGLAGCQAPGRTPRGSASGGDATGTTATGNDATAATAGTPPSPGDVDLPVPESALSRAAPRDAIPAVVDPAVAPDWSGVAIEFGRGDGAWTYRPRLGPDDEVIGVARDGAARAYPLKLLRRHEVVNDVLGGPIAVTYCPVCASGVVVERVVDGVPATFGVSGFLWHSDLVMYDQATDSLWSQIMATAIRGPKTGTTLRILPASTTTWRAWRNEHPGTTVVLPAPLSGTVVGEVRINYEVDLYSDLDKIAEQYPDAVNFGNESGWTDTRLRRRRVVLGVATGGGAVAYPKDVVRREWPIHDVVGDVPVVVAAGPGDSLAAYDRRVDGTVLDFDRDGGHLRGGESRWSVLTGAALDGPHEGRRLRAIPGAVRAFWFAWLGFHPDTTVYREG